MEIIDVASPQKYAPPHPLPLKQERVGSLSFSLYDGYGEGD